MELQVFSTIGTSLAAIFSGLVFGFLLRRAKVTQFDVIVGQLLLKDFTVMKVIITAIFFGSIGIYFFNFLGLITSFQLSSTPLWFSLIGGGVFGIGMSITGYCPGTAVAAIADGSRDMIFGIIGMLFGAMIFNEFSFCLLPLIERPDNSYKTTVGDFLKISNLGLILAIGIALLLYAFVTRKKKIRLSLSFFKKINSMKC